MADKKDLNELQVNSWRVIEALAERQFDLASVEELASDTNLTPPQVRRILVTWEHLGITERRGEMWRLTEALTITIPHKLRMALAEKFREVGSSQYSVVRPPHVDINVGQETSAEKIGMEHPSHQEGDKSVSPTGEIDLPVQEYVSN